MGYAYTFQSVMSVDKCYQHLAKFPIHAQMVATESGYKFHRNSYSPSPKFKF